MSKKWILLVEDVREDALLLGTWIARQTMEFEVVTAATLEEGLAFLERHNIDVILLDIGLSYGGEGAVVDAIMEYAEDRTLIVLSDREDEELALQAVKAGAQDYLIKGQVRDDTLLQSIRYGIERKAAQLSMQRINAQLQAAVRTMHRSNQARRTLVANASHELRNPLAAIQSCLDVIQRAGPLVKTQVEFLQGALRNSARLGQLISGMLDLASFDIGAIDLTLAQVNLTELIAQVCDATRDSARGRHIKIETHIGALPPLLADRDKLAVVLSNLLSNAVKYSPDRTTIRVEARLRNSDNQTFAEIQTIDEGVGIASNDIDRIFEPFHRGSHNTQSIAGNGLGLAIVKETVELHGGSITVDSQVGKGSKFTVCLPLTRQEDLADIYTRMALQMAGRTLTNLMVLEVVPTTDALDSSASLQSVAETLQKKFRGSDRVVVRNERNDLVVLLNDATRKSTPVIISKILEAFRGHTAFSTLNDGAALPLKIGMAVYPEDGKASEELLGAAAQHQVYPHALLGAGLASAGS